MAKLKKKRVVKLRSSQSVPKVFEAIATPAEIAPIRGVKLKTVSRLTMVFALLCLLAFIAGRPPVPASKSALLMRHRIAAVSATANDAFRFSRGVAASNGLSNDAVEIPSYGDRPFYIEFRLGNYELGLGKRNENQF